MYTSVCTWLVIHVLLYFYLAGDACTPLCAGLCPGEKFLCCDGDRLSKDDGDRPERYDGDRQARYDGDRLERYEGDLEVR